MNKLKSIFKVLTFLDVEIFLLCTIMIFSLYFSNRYIQKSLSTTSAITSKIIENDYNIASLDKKYRDFKNADDELLFKSISGKDLEKSLIKFDSYKSHFYQYDNSKLNSLLIKKEKLFIEIYNYKLESDKLIDVKNLKEKKRIRNKDAKELISDLEHHKNYDSIFYTQIYQNALINIELRDIITNYNNLKSIENVESQNKITRELYKNYKSYMIVLIVTIFVFTLCISLIVIDIKKDDRNKYLISVLINQFTID